MVDCDEIGYDDVAVMVNKYSQKECERVGVCVFLGGERESKEGVEFRGGGNLEATRDTGRQPYSLSTQKGQ